MIEAYLDALPQGRAPRILASCTVFVADDRKEAMRLAEIGLARQRARYATIGRTVFVEGMSVLDQTSRSLVPLTTHTRECRATAPQRERSLLRADSPAEETGFEPSVPLGSGSAGKVERRRLDKWIPLAGDHPVSSSGESVLEVTSPLRPIDRYGCQAARDRKFKTDEAGVAGKRCRLKSVAGP
jgi:hypothetical protein